MPSSHHTTAPQWMRRAIQYPALAFSLARCAQYNLEYSALRMISRVAFRKMDAGLANPPPELIRRVQKDLRAFLRQDSENIARGVYPLSVLKPESPVRHFRRLPWIVWDGVSIFRRRERGRTAVFDSRAKELLEDLPRYYRRNFHFQSNGYLSERSARLYEHQVEMLFGGSADAMRRLMISALKKKLGPRLATGEGLRFLEIGVGTGRATHFMHLAFPQAKIVGIDLSEPYLREAQKKLWKDDRVHLLQGDGAALDFADGTFDVVYSVFLFHELPLNIRKKVIAESKRVLKRGGILGLVDSVQLHDESSFKSLLENFPREYHEPFYRDYISRPMESLLKAARLRGVQSERGFFSKTCIAKK